MNYLQLFEFKVDLLTINTAFIFLLKLDIKIFCYLRSLVLLLNLYIIY